MSETIQIPEPSEFKETTRINIEGKEITQWPSGWYEYCGLEGNRILLRRPNFFFHRFDYLFFPIEKYKEVFSLAIQKGMGAKVCVYFIKREDNPDLEVHILNILEETEVA